MDADTRKSLGRKAAEAVRQHFDVSVQGPLLLDVLERTVAASERPRQERVATPLTSRLRHEPGTGELVVEAGAEKVRVPLTLVNGAPHLVDLPFTLLFPSREIEGPVRVRFLALAVSGWFTIGRFEIRDVATTSLVHDFFDASIAHGHDLEANPSGDGTQCHWTCRGPNAWLRTKPWDPKGHDLRQATLQIELEISSQSELDAERNAIDRAEKVDNLLGRILRIRQPKR